VTDSCEQANETSSSIKGGEFLDSLSDSFSRRTLLHGVSHNLDIKAQFSLISTSFTQYCKI
jgi:hypothetical protein